MGGIIFRADRQDGTCGDEIFLFGESGQGEIRRVSFFFPTLIFVFGTMRNIFPATFL
jgi:hypothetical protein